MLNPVNNDHWVTSRQAAPIRSRSMLYHRSQETLSTASWCCLSIGRSKLPRDTAPAASIEGETNRMVPFLGPY